VKNENYTVAIEVTKSPVKFSDISLMMFQNFGLKNLKENVPSLMMSLYSGQEILIIQKTS